MNILNDIESQPENNVNVKLLMAIAVEGLDDMSAAANCFCELIAIEPNNINHCLGAVRCLFALKDYEKAI